MLAWKSLSDRERGLMKNCDMAAFESALARGVEVWENPEYREVDPTRFSPVLFRWGQAAAFDAPIVAIVGTRRSTTYGTAAAAKFAGALAGAGITVASGGALGIDYAAHRGAVDAGGRSLAVLPCGVDRAYPERHRDLYTEIRQRGCLVSQYACGFRTNSDYSFLQRNATLAALADLVLVIEAPERSGAISTASAAIDQNKPVLVVPGNITMPSFEGSHQLIRDGATLVTHPAHVLEALSWSGALPESTRSEPTNDLQVKILDVLGAESLSAEKISELTGIESAVVLAELTDLELDGIVLRDGIGYALNP